MMVLALSLLSGCSSWIDQDAACQYAVYDWSDDLLANILAGDGSGAFDYDPADTPRQAVTGSYHPKNGNYNWTVSYADSYYLKSTEVSGYGTAYHNGDLDILQTSTITDVLDAVTSVVTRTKRESCDMVVETWPEDAPDQKFVKEGSYKDDESFAWTAEDDLYAYQGGLRMNLSSTFKVDAKDGSYSASTTTKPTGVADTDFSGTCGGSATYTCDGSTHTRFDGGAESEYAMAKDGDPYANIVSDFGYDGSGTLTATYASGKVCDYTYASDGSCDCSCDDGSRCSC